MGRPGGEVDSPPPGEQAVQVPDEPSLWIARTVWVVIALCVGRAVWLLSTVGYFRDDTVNFASLHRIGFGWSYLTASDAGHFYPGLRIVNWLVAQTNPIARWPAVAIEVVALALLLYLCWRIMTRFIRPSWVMVVLIGMLGWSVVTTATLAWWSASLTYLISGVLGLVTLNGYLRFEAGADWHALIPAVIAFTVGLGFSEVVGLSLAAGILLVMFYDPGVRSLRSVGSFIGTRWRVWVAFFVPLALALAWRISHASSYRLSPAPSIGVLFRYARVAVGQGFSASVFGFTYPSPDRQVVSANYVLAAIQIMVVLFVVSIVRRRDAYKAWIVAALSLVALAVVHGEARASVFGPAFGTTYSDLLPALVVFVLCMAIALGTPILAGNDRVAAPRSALPPLRHLIGGLATDRPWTKPVALGLGLCLALAYAVLVSANTTYINEVKEGRTAKLQLATVTSDWPTTSHGSPSAYIWDTLLPFPLIEPGPYPDDLASRVLPLFVPGVRTGSHPRTGFLVTASGSLVAAQYRSIQSILGVTHPPVASPGVTPSHLGTSFCLSSSNRPGLVRLQTRTTLDEPMPQGRWFARLDVTRLHGGTVVIVGSTSPNGTGHGVGVIRPGTQIVGLAEGPSNGPTIYIAPHSSLCLASASIGLPQPSQPASKG